MKNITALFFSLLVFFTAVSAFACGPSWDSPAEIGILALLVSLLPMTVYSTLSAGYMLAMRKRHALNFKPAAWIWAKASMISYFVSMTAIFSAAVVNKSINLPDNLMITFVASAPLVALAGYFTRVYYDTKKEIV